MRLATATWMDVENYLKTKNGLILPLGSTEQHALTGPIATDTLCAEAVANDAAEKLGIMVAPAVSYGVASHHMGFPGSATLRPSVYQAVLKEILESFFTHGFRRFYVINGHGGNDPSIRATFQELKHKGAEGASFSLFNWWQLPEVQALAQELFGDEDGAHATPTELSLAFHLEAIAPRPFDPSHKNTPNAPRAWPLTATEMRKTFPSGAIYSNPALARPEHGPRILSVATDAVVQAILQAPVLD